MTTTSNLNDLLCWQVTYIEIICGRWKFRLSHSPSRDLQTHFPSNPISLWPLQTLGGRPMNIEIAYFIHVTECGFICMYKGV